MLRKADSFLERFLNTICCWYPKWQNEWHKKEDIKLEEPLLVHWSIWITPTLTLEIRLHYRIETLVHSACDFLYSTFPPKEHSPFRGNTAVVQCWTALGSSSWQEQNKMIPVKETWWGRFPASFKTHTWSLISVSWSRQTWQLLGRRETWGTRKLCCPEWNSPLFVLLLYAELLSVTASSCVLLQARGWTVCVVCTGWVSCPLKPCQSKENMSKSSSLHSSWL